MERVSERLPGMALVGKITRIAQVSFEVVAAPGAGGEWSERGVPAGEKQAGVGFVAQFPTG